MSTRLSYILVVALSFVSLAFDAKAQITSLDELQSGHTYLLQNVNGYGYCIYESSRSGGNSSWFYGSSTYLTLGGATVEHPTGCVNEGYKDEVDSEVKDNQWSITSAGNGLYYLKNVGQNKYATNQTTSNWGGQQWNSTDSWQLTTTATPIKITTISSGVFAFQTNADQSSTGYMCAASHTQNAIANWEITDLGSQWWIVDTDNSLTTKIERIALNATQVSLNVNDSYTLTAQIQPADATRKTLKWESSNEKVATVSDGVVKALKTGTTTIKASATDGSGKVATCNVVVSKAGQGEKVSEMGTIRYYTLTDGQLIAIPEKYITGEENKDDALYLTLTGDTVVGITHNHLASVDTIYVGDLPRFESFKFNNKFNDQLFDDAEGVIDDSLGRVDLEVATIGKRLTPSFKVPEGANVWMEGVHQLSKKTSQRYEDDLVYTVAYPKNYIYKVRKVSDAVYKTPEEVDPEEEWISTPVELTAEMFSTNAPSNVGEDPVNLLDGNTSTFFHTTWGTGQYTKLTWSEGATYGDGQSEWPYLQIDLPEDIYTLRFSYTTRETSNYAPKGFIIQGSNDGETWEDAYELGDKDNLPMEAGATYNSPVISLGNNYSKLRFQLTASSKKNYLVMSEFALWKVTENPEFGKDTTSTEPILISPAVYENRFVPFGRDYTVHVNYLTDQSKGAYNVPTIRINTFDGQMISSKTVYKEATFELDGAGIWDDIKVDTMQIRGRGNTSWSSSTSAKNPYRLKFDKKIKPFGLTKGKSWVLLANKQSGSMTTNAIAMKLADRVKTEGCNHIIPVELYINGDYRGSYNFTEKVGFSNNSIALDDETNAAMLELDSYYDEPYKFRDQAYSLPVNIKAPDFSDAATVTNLTQSMIEKSFGNLTYNLKIAGGDLYTKTMDAHSIATAMFVNDLTRNQELKHPKSWYLYNEDVVNDSVWKLGPVWDFDWGYGYDGSYTYFQSGAETSVFQGMTTSNIGYSFFYDLLNNSEVVKKEYYRVWTEFLNNGGLSDLMEYCDDLYDFANPSFKHNATKWSDGNGYATITTNAKTWLTKRVNYIYSHLTPYDLGEDIEDPYADPGHPDRIDLAKELSRLVDVYSINGVLVKRQVAISGFAAGLAPGVYVVGGRKVVVR